MEPHNGDDKAHLPAPSLWPVGFAVGIACLLVGVVVSWPAVIVGGALALLFGFLWVRDAARGYRTAPAVLEPEAAAPTATAPAIPANEGEAGMPEPEPGERFPRSKFLEGATLGVGALIGGAVTVPAVGLMVAPAFTHQGHGEIDVGPVTDYPEGQWVVTTFMLNPAEGEVTRRTAYIRNNGFLSEQASFTIISNRCAHLGCPVQPNGLIQDDKAHEAHLKGGEIVRTIPVIGLSGFGCPCHGGAYDKEGNRTAGPPVRGLDRYDFAIRDGRLFLRKTYSVAHVEGEGADAKIRRYELAGPGQHVHGIESWLYPLQPPH